jgi:1,4-dihydroxy-2-naphthoate octaprenyltransferase
MASLAQKYPRLAAWYRAARPRSLTATYVPLALGAVIAVDREAFNLLRFVLALLGALALQIAANLINEYVDFVRGSDAVLTPPMILAGAIAAVAVGVLIGIVLVIQSGWTLLWIGAGGVLIVITYTAGPFPLAYLGLGELAVFIFMGPLMVLGTYYAVSGGTVSTDGVLASLFASLPVAFLVANILHANNMRDLEADRAANKRTLAVRFGMAFARGEYAFWIIGAYLSLAGLVAAGRVPWLCMVALVTLQEGRRLIHAAYTTGDAMVLHSLQGRTARLHRDFGASLVIGWIAWLLILGLIGAIAAH